MANFKNKNLVHMIYNMLIFLTLFIVSKTLLEEIYLFEWTARHYYLYIWIVPIVYLFFRKINSAYIVTFGNIIGILSGQFIGDILRNINMNKITPDMSAEQIYRLSSHKGFFIWISIVIISISISFIVRDKETLK